MPRLCLPPRLEGVHGADGMADGGGVGQGKAQKCSHTVRLILLSKVEPPQAPPATRLFPGGPLP